jgi:hypothetical protein
MMETVEADNVTVEALAVMVTGVQDVADNITLGDEVVIARVVAGELDVVQCMYMPTSISRSHNL